MASLHLRIITPKAVILEEEIESITAPASDGEVTVLHNHVPLFSLLKEGVVTIRKGGDENFFSIGGGYLETDGKHINLLVSRAYGQDQIDEKEVNEAKTQAEKALQEATTEDERHAAMLTLRRSIVDLKLLRKKPRRTRTQ